MFFGGLSGFSGEDAARKWLSDEIWWHGLPEPLDVYTKGDFNGKLYAKFAHADAKVALSKLKSIKLEHGGKEIFAKEHLMLPTRIERSVMYLGKEVLIANQWDKTSLWTDVEENKLYCGNDVVFTVRVKNNNIDLSFEPGWEEYIVNERSWKEGLEKQIQRIKSSSAVPTKGVGKGKIGKKRSE